MSTLIPLRSELPYFDLHISLDGVTYTLTLRWNVRVSAWFLEVASEDGSEIYLTNLKLVANYPLAASRLTRRPPGAFVCVDGLGDGADPGFGDLAVRHSLLYFSAAELGLDVATTQDAAVANDTGGTMGPRGPRGYPGKDGTFGGLLGSAEFDGSTTSVDVVFDPAFGVTPKVGAGHPVILDGEGPVAVWLSNPSPTGFTVNVSSPVACSIPWWAAP